VLLIVENIVLVYPLHMLVLIFDPVENSFRMPLKMLPEAVIVGAFEEADH
jgi:hypothetical protein